ncbi:MAG TPA: type 1 glutamine amidotransferase [Candidatus Goldiibacteriota bacterium]|nr:type 1 glutamine amidotransferase [Candidatus Goldiibacteriota bacterium]
MRVHYLQHCDNEDLANIKPWLIKRRHSVSRTMLHKSEKLPPINSFDWLIIMGGPMNVDEHAKYPWLKAEKSFIREAIASGKTVLGICLGGQLISRSLGAKVAKNKYREIGWHSVRLTPAGKKSVLFRGFPSVFTPIHWHGDTFSLPKGVRLLASSRACRNQAYEYKGNVFALQFHVEYSRKHIEEYFRIEKEPGKKGPFEQSEKQILAESGLFKKLEKLTRTMLENIEKAAADSLLR